MGGLPGDELRRENLQRALNHFIDIHRLKLRRGHLGEIAEASDDGLHVGEFRQQGLAAFARDLVKLSRRGINLARARSRFSTVI